MQYEIIKYPDSQISVKLTDISYPYCIYERINSYEDIIKVKAIVEALDFNHIKNRHLRIPCLFGQRSDRRFDKLQSFDLKVIADIINSCNFMDVEIFDPHSDVSLALINNSFKRDALEYIKFAIEDIGTDNLVLVSPDAGAYKKVFKYGEELKLPVMAANKYRDLKGNVTLNILGDVRDKNCLIIDDLLDGGFTFHVLGEKLKEQGANKVFLYISHAYFNKGVNFTTNIDHFYCTNSVKDIENELVTQYKII